MKIHRISALAAAGCLSCWIAISSQGADDGAKQPAPPEAIGSLSVPNRFTDRVASPLVERPIIASFDDRGRLYVADSSGVNLPGAELVKIPPHRIVILEDTDRDVVFDASPVMSSPPLLRAATAAEAIGRSALPKDQLTRLAEPLALAGPLELPKMLAAFTRGGDALVGAALLASLDRAPGAKSLRSDVLQLTLANYPAEVRQSAAPLLDRLSVSAAG